MKKYLYFGWEYYYPMGGLGDLKAMSDSAVNIMQIANSEEHGFYAKRQIVDSQTLEVVWTNYENDQDVIEVLIDDEIIDER